LVNARALFSNYGTRVRVAAPGEPDLDVTCGSASKTDYTRRYGGTSGASAKAAGAIALTVSANAALTHADLIKILGDLKPNVSSQLPIGNFVNCEEMVDAAIRLKNQRPPRATIASDE
jgi:subtilisin family serine protease